MCGNDMLYGQDYQFWNRERNEDYCIDYLFIFWIKNRIKNIMMYR